MIIQEVLNAYKEKLIHIYSTKEINSIVWITLEFVLQKSKTEIRLLQLENYTLKKEEKNKLQTILNQLHREKPLQYILGETQFYGIPISVNESVLIPRPETEELVSWVIDSNKQSKWKRSTTILDIGTGSGCISIALAKSIKKGKIYALDISETALEVAKRNAKMNEVEIIFYRKDILKDALNELPKLDIIISNPPYITLSEKNLMKRNVLDYEPDLALFADHALTFYKRIAKLALKKLKIGGELFFEINQYYGKEIISLLKELGYQEIELRKDLYGNERMIKAVYKKCLD
ncbi:MAG: peptide chain release factor N(5)-glutamine methyltransferase [Flavobacteriales bacterium]